MPGVLIGLNKADMFMVFISSFVCKIHFKEYNTSFNPSAKVVWVDLFSILALRVEPLKILLGLSCQRLVPCCVCSASMCHCFFPQTLYTLREGASGF